MPPHGVFCTKEKQKVGGVEKETEKEEKMSICWPTLLQGAWVKIVTFEVSTDFENSKFCWKLIFSRYFFFLIFFSYISPLSAQIRTFKPQKTNWEKTKIFFKLIPPAGPLCPAPPPPPNVDYVFFSHHCFIILFQFLDIIFTLKVKKTMWKVDSAQNPPPPPLWTKSIQMFFCFF